MSAVTTGGDATARFFDALPVRERLDDIVDGAAYTPVPDGWWIAAADIEGSTERIAAGGYKTVNLVGAAVIAAITNGLGHDRVPVQFGGDGAVAAIAPDAEVPVRRALAACARWAGAEFGIHLRTALQPVDAVRADGFDVAVARLRASDAVDYAMFAGGGVSAVERAMKAGSLAPVRDEGTEAPDLTGLSCRWTPARSRAGTIVSLVATATATATPRQVAKALGDIVSLLDRLPRGGHPIDEEGPGFAFPPQGLRLEAHASRGAAPLWRRRAGVFAETLIAWLFHRFSLSVGGFDARHYVRQTGRNADFRKFEDGLRVTVDCTPAVLGKLRRRLERARTDGVLRYGLVEQEEAVLTCIVPSVVADDHRHFVDGAGGGYAAAAARMHASPS